MVGDLSFVEFRVNRSSVTARLSPQTRDEQERMSDNE
jgi:hypothetical protein